MSEKLASPQPGEKSVPIQQVSSSATMQLAEPFALLQRLDQIRAAIERRAYELFLENGAVDGFDVQHWTRAEDELLHPVHLSLAESEEALTAKAELPGFSANEIQVSLEPGRLTISGKKESGTDTEKGKTIYREHCSTEIFRSIQLPVEVDASRTTATLKDGVLELVMPKAAEAKAIQVQVKAAASGT